MKSINVPIPDDLWAFAEARAAEAGFASVESYVASLIENDRAAVPIGAEVEAELLRGLDSGEPIEVGSEIWETLKRRVRQRRRPA